MAVTTYPRARCGPRAGSRRAFRHPAALRAEPAGVEVLAAVKHARAERERVHEWDARLETSAIAALAYMWRRGRGEKWAGCHGSARYACSIAQLVIGLAPIMGWQGIPDRGDEQAVARFVKRHRKSVQRWLDWLQLAGLVSHTPQQDEEGFWWRTIIELHPVPQLPAELLHEAVDRRAGWTARERRRDARGRRRNLTAILRRARLSKAQRRARGIARRRELARHAERQRVRAQVADSLAQVAKTHVTQPCGASTTSRNSLEEVSQDETLNRRLTGARALFSPIAQPNQASTTGGGEGEFGRTLVGEDLRWAVYNEVMAARFSRSDEEWEPTVATGRRRVAELVDWPADRPVERWRLIEAWTHVSHGPYMAVAGGFRLAFWSEQRDHHGPRLKRALRRYERFCASRPPGWPKCPVAAFAVFLAGHVARQEGPQHGLAYDVQRFNEITKQMSAYAHYQRPEHLEHAAARAERQHRVQEVAEQVNARLGFRVDQDSGARLRRACELLDSDYPPHRQAGRDLYALARREEQLVERDGRLLGAEHPGQADGRYRAACAHSQRWGLPMPPGRWEGR